MNKAELEERIAAEQEEWKPLIGKTIVSVEHRDRNSYGDPRCVRVNFSDGSYVTLRPSYQDSEVHVG